MREQSPRALTYLAAFFLALIFVGLPIARVVLAAGYGFERAVGLIFSVISFTVSIYPIGSIVAFVLAVGGAYFSWKIAESLPGHEHPRRLATACATWTTVFVGGVGAIPIGLTVWILSSFGHPQPSDARAMRLVSFHVAALIAAVAVSSFAAAYGVARSRRTGRNP